MSLRLGNLALCTVNVVDKSDSDFNVMESASCEFRLGVLACMCLPVFAAADVLVCVRFL